MRLSVSQLFIKRNKKRRKNRWLQARVGRNFPPARKAASLVRPENPFVTSEAWPSWISKIQEYGIHNNEILIIEIIPNEIVIIMKDTIMK